MRRPTTGQRELRASQIQDASVDGTDTGDLLFTGYAAVYEQPSEFMGFTESIRAGAFDRILSESPDVRMLGMNHDPSIVFARTAAGTLDLSSDAHGLKVEARLARTMASEQLAASVERGDVSTMSYGFASAKDLWDESDPENVTRTLLDFRALYDVSPVAFAAFPQTEAAFRSLCRNARGGKFTAAEKRAIMQLTVWTDDDADEPDAEDVADGGADEAAETDPAAITVRASSEEDETDPTLQMSHRSAAALRERRRRLLAHHI